MPYLRACFLSLIMAAMLSACGGGDVQNPAATDTSKSGFEPKLPLPRAAAEITPVGTSSALAIQAVNLQDAIAILKMIVGLEVNSSGQSVTAYQAYAADVDGNGKVELVDAIAVLKRVVGLETPSANWLVFNQTDSAPVVSDRLNPGIAPDLKAYVTSAATSNVGLVAVLRGDVVGSQFSYVWSLTSKPSNSDAKLTGANAASPTFTADVVGSYVATLTVSDGSSNTSLTRVTLTAALVLPGMPTIGAATLGDSTARIEFIPGSTGDQTVTYTASCVANGATTVISAGAASPITVTGLTNGVTYACKITPSSVAGIGSASGSASVTPACTVSNGTGAGVVANIGNMAVNCSNITYTISGAATGLATGNQVTLLNNSGNATTVTTNGVFSFSTPVSQNGTYAVTIGTQPTGQTCVVNNASGAGIAADVSNIQVACTSLGVTTKIGVNGSYARGVAIQADGKIVVAGVGITANRDGDFAVARYSSSGSLDPSFGGTGVVTTNISGRVASTDWVRGVAIQSDGKIIVVGYTQKSGDAAMGLALVRYLEDGSLDTSFAGTGIIVSVHPSKDKTGHSVAIQSDGKIIIAGGVTCTKRTLGKYCTLLERYNSNGSRDTTFNGPGADTTDDSTEGAAGLVLQNDGKILVVGGKDSGNGLELSVARYKPDGQRDSIFGISGLTTVAIGTDVGTYNWGTSIELQVDGNIVVSGVAHSNSANNHFSLTRLLPSGSVDVSFGKAGSVVTNVSIPPNSGYSYAVTVQSDGKIVVAGESMTVRADPQPYPGFYMAANLNFAAVRYTTSGNLDISFGGTGIVTTDINFLDDRCYGVAIQPNGSIVLAGESFTYDPLNNYGGYSSFGVLRIKSDGSVDATFSSRN